MRHTVLTVGADRSHALSHHAADDRHDRGCGRRGCRSQRDARARRPDRHDGDQLRRRALDRRRRRARRSAIASSFVLSFGGHGDLPRTLRYLCTGIQPDGTRRPPHDYGVAIILLGVAERVVPADRWSRCATAILTFLEGSRLDMVDKAQSAAEFEHARGARGRASRAGADADELRQHARRRAPRPDPAAARRPRSAAIPRCRRRARPRPQRRSICCTARTTT